MGILPPDALGHEGLSLQECLLDSGQLLQFRSARTIRQNSSSRVPFMNFRTTQLSSSSSTWKNSLHTRLRYVVGDSNFPSARASSFSIAPSYLFIFRTFNSNQYSSDPPHSTTCLSPVSLALRRPVTMETATTTKKRFTNSV